MPCYGMKLKIAQLSPYPLLCICLPDRRLPWWLRWQKRLPTMQEIWVRFLGWEDPLEKEMATQSSILAWKIPWTEEAGRLQSTGLQRVRHDWVTSLSLSLSCIGEGNGNPLQCSCLENPRDGGAWWATIYGVTQSWT